MSSASRLSATSPCRAAGTTIYSTGLDIDGDLWLNPASIGCSEYQAGAVTGAVTVAIGASWTNVAVGFGLDLTAQINGRVVASAWDFGDGTGASNRPYALHAWVTAGNYTVTLRAYNEDHPEGASAAMTVQVLEHPMHYVSRASTNPVLPYLSWETAARTIQDAVDAAAVGGEVVVGDGTYAIGGRAVWGVLTNRVALDRPVVVRSINGPELTLIQGYQVPGTTNGSGAIRCIYLTNGATLSGFTLTNGATQNLGNEEREQSGGGAWCQSITALVTNCTVTGNSASYGAGGIYYGLQENCRLAGNCAHYGVGGGAELGTLKDCILTANSASGNGGGAYSATLNGCTLAGNSTLIEGGGAYFGTLSNCILTGNSARAGGGGAARATLNTCTLAGNSASGGGGGADSSTLNNCTLTGNSAYLGGGTAGGTLNNCTVTGNSADLYGGGVFAGTLKNCIVFYNTAGSEPNYSSGSVLYSCCTTPRPSLVGGGHITAEPLFVDRSNGDLRLQSNSPCINAGINACAPGLTDLDGNPRIVSGNVDIGAYEFQGKGSVISYAWLQQYGLATDGSDDTTDPDSDGLNNWQEWLCGTNPTNVLSTLRMLSPAGYLTGVTVTWQSVTDRSYFLERSINIGAHPSFLPIAADIPGQPGTTTYTDTSAPSAGPAFYRIGIQP